PAHRPPDHKPLARRERRRLELPDRRRGRKGGPAPRHCRPGLARRAQARGALRLAHRRRDAQRQLVGARTRASRGMTPGAWYFARSAGIVAYLLLSSSVLLGVLMAGK